jgi:hypothetical protein
VGELLAVAELEQERPLVGGVVVRVVVDPQGGGALLVRVAEHPPFAGLHRVLGVAVRALGDVAAVQVHGEGHVERVDLIDDDGPAAPCHDERGHHSVEGADAGLGAGQQRDVRLAGGEPVEVVARES